MVDVDVRVVLVSVIVSVRVLLVVTV